MNKSGLIATGMVCATALVISAMLANAGILNPPSGAVAPTGPTIIDALPFSIDTPGSYVLIGDLNPPFDAPGIEITTSDVTIDMRGFSLIGTLAADTAAILSFPGTSNISVINGTARDWLNTGIDLSNSTHCHIRDIRAHSNGAGGIVVGDSATLERVSAINNQIFVGIQAGDGSVIESSIASGNGGAGISVGPSSVMADCSAKTNGAAGIVLGNDSTATACSSSNNGNNGFFGQFGVTIESCTAQLNSNDGFRVSSGSSITRCTARANSGDGIEVVSNCLVTDNNCSDNGQDPLLEGAGVNATGNDNRVESNHLVSNSRGVLLAGTGTYINDNTVRANTLDNYDLVAGNLVNILLCDIHEEFLVPANVEVAGTMASTTPTSPGVRLRSFGRLDLNGHALLGDTNGTSSNIGVRMDFGGSVENGFVNDWGGRGVILGGTAVRAFGSTTNVVASGNGSIGIDATQVIDCSAFDNGSTGISATIVSQCRVEECATGANGSVITNSAAVNNTVIGLGADAALAHGNYARNPGAVNISGVAGTVIENHEVP